MRDGKELACMTDMTTRTGMSADSYPFVFKFLHVVYLRFSMTSGVSTNFQQFPCPDLWPERWCLCRRLMP